MHSWWHEGWDLLLTPTLAELPLKLGTIVNDPDNPMSPMRRAGEFVPFTPAVQHERPTSDQPPAGVDGRGLAGRRAARRRLWARGRPDPHRESARAGEALGGPHTGDLSEKSAGGGTRTHTFFRTRAPKASAYRQFRHARSVVDRTPSAATGLVRRRGLTWIASPTKGAGHAVCRRVQRCTAPYRGGRERLRDCATTWHTATDCARLAAPDRRSRRRLDWRTALRRRPRLRRASGSRLLLPPRHVSRRRLHLAGTPRVAPPDHAATRSTRRSSSAAAKPSTLLMPGQRAGVVQRVKGCVDVSLYSKHWPCLLPQHGPGRKHTAPIALEPWQQASSTRPPKSSSSA